MARKTKEELTHEEYLCWDIRLRHPRWSQAQIAEEIQKVHGIEISQPTVSRALDRANKRYLRKTERNIAAFKGQQLARLDYIYDQANNGWHRSYGTTKSMRKTSTKTTEAPTDDFKLRWHQQMGDAIEELPSVVTVEEETLTMDAEDIAGSTAFLSEMRACVADQNKLMGVNAPDETINTNVNANYAAELPTPVSKEEWAAMMGEPLNVETEQVNHDAESEKS